MRTYAVTIAAALLLAFPASAFSQAVEVGPKGFEVERMHTGRSAWRLECRELRKSCLNKEELGEQGQGNCQRYRRMCGLD